MQYVIAGLGNPESKYESTRHNVGFLALDRLEKLLNIQINQKKFDGLFTQTIYNGSKLYLIKPLTYMNLSGRSVAEIKNYYKIEASNLIVIHDELDLLFGKIKIKIGGGTAGHNGIKSIVNSLGDNSFVRIRVGIGKPPTGQDGSSYVLSNFSRKEMNELEDSVLDQACDAALEIVSNGVKSAMNKINSKEKN